MSTKPVLAYDCATEGASIALRVGAHTLSRQLVQSSQAAELVPTIDAMLREAGVAYHELGAIVTTVGPGSFTGVRIGLAALHGFVLVAGTPVKLLSTLEACAWQQAAVAACPDHFIISLRAGKGEVYAQSFQLTGGLAHATSDIALQPEDKTDWPLPHFTHRIDAQRLCELAALLPELPLAQAVPLYIRPPDAIAPAPYGWLVKN